MRASPRRCRRRRRITATSSAGSSSGKTITISETEYKLTPSTVTLSKAGAYEFKAVNNGSVAHALEIAEGVGDWFQRVERGDFDGLARAAGLDPDQARQWASEAGEWLLEQREKLRRRRALVVGRRRIAGELPCGLPQLGHALGQLRAAADLEREIATGGAQRLEDAGEHAAQPVGPVRGEQA